MARRPVLGAVVAAVSSVVLTVPAVAAESTPDPVDPGPVPAGGALAVEVINVNGAGCPAGTAAVVVHPDNRYFRVVYSGFLAEIGPGVPAESGRVQCLVSVSIRYPSSEYSFAVDQVRHEGRISLAAGAAAQVRAVEYFSGATVPGTAQQEYAGPLVGWWDLVDDRDETLLRWRPCNLSNYTLSINSQIYVRRGSSAADAVGSMSHDESWFHLTWRRC